MDEKIIEAEIIKALECCKMPVGSKGCKQCPLRTVRDMRLTEGDHSCTTIMLDLAIDLINRQKAEIERLEKKAEIVSCGDYGFVYEGDKDGVMEVRDDDIIKALECCQVDKSCKGCPSQRKFGKDAMCPHLNRLAVDLINRQKAEIERLEKANESFSCMGKMYSEIKSEARIEFAERLKAKGTSPELDEGKYYNDYDIDRTLAEMESERE